MHEEFLNKRYSSNLPSRDSSSSRKEWEETCWREILKSKALLELLTTVHERHDLVMRATALEGILSGKSYRQISKELNLSLQTISVVKKALNERIYRSYLERSKKERKKKRYSSGSRRFPVRPSGTPQRTKYGTVYIP